MHERRVAEFRSAQLVTSEKLRQIIDGPAGYGAGAFTGVFYAGSDENCDYLALRYGDLGVRVLKAQRGAVDLKHRMSIKLRRECLGGRYEAVPALALTSSVLQET
ncbi:MAG TPA: hypothetical protein VN893_22265 [Bryobacteraceae bacterium]|nr:hypothetical protein [Bryobacteraceae bacterium]